MTLKPQREPLAAPAPDRAGAVEIQPGMRVVRRPIFQAEAGAPNTLAEMVGRIAVAKSLGFTAFEIDVTPIKVHRAKQSGEAKVSMSDMYRLYFTYTPTPIEGDEWKDDKEQAHAKSLAASHIITVYALVVE